MEQLTRRVLGELDVCDWRLKEQIGNEYYYRSSGNRKRIIRLDIQKDQIQLLPVRRDGLERDWSLTFHGNGEIEVYEHSVLQGRTTWQSFRENLTAFGGSEPSSVCIPSSGDFLANCIFHGISAVLFGY
jgi:hypothetical protein